MKVNIPLNYHSSVIAFHQKKNSDQVGITFFSRSSDNDQGKYLDFFRAFAIAADITILEGVMCLSI